MIEIREFTREDDSSPFANWFDGLDAQAAAKVTTYLTQNRERQYVFFEKLRKRGA